MEANSASVTEALPYGRGAAPSAVLAFSPCVIVRASRRKGIDGSFRMLRQHSYFSHVNALWAGKGAGPRGLAAGAGTGEGSAETWCRGALLLHRRWESLQASEPRSPGHWPPASGGGLECGIQLLELNECFQNKSISLCSRSLIVPFLDFWASRRQCVPRAS